MKYKVTLYEKVRVTQCPMYNGTLKKICLIKYELEIYVFVYFHLLFLCKNDVRFKETIEKCTEINGITTNFGRYKGRPVKTSDLQTSDWYKCKTDTNVGPVSYTHLTLPTKRIV